MQTERKWCSWWVSLEFSPNDKTELDLAEQKCVKIAGPKSNYKEKKSHKETEIETQSNASE